jgi:catalase
MRTDGNGRETNYFPNSFDEMQIDQAYKEPLLRSIAVLQTGTIVIVKGKRSFLGNLFKIMSVEQQQNTINNIVTHMSGIEGPKSTKSLTGNLAFGTG